MIWRTENIPASGIVEDFAAPVKMIYWGQDDLSRGYVTQEWLLLKEEKKTDTFWCIYTKIEPILTGFHELNWR